MSQTILPEASQPRRNIELKARCRDLTAARLAVEGLGAKPTAMLQQLDTYFLCNDGRLKLRETAGRGAELIWYARSDEAKARASDYRLVPISNPHELKAALTAGLGIRGEVRKRRDLLLWQNVRIHLDEVDGLGTFVEFEAVMTSGEDEQTAHDRLERLCHALHISPSDYLSASYSDLKLLD